MSDGIHFRSSTLADVDDLYGVWRRAVAATHDFVAAGDLAEIDRLVRNQYLPGAEFTVACGADGRVLAFMGMSGSTIDSLFVDADVRGSGIGRRLVEYARRLHPEGLTVDVNEQNVQAVGFYERLGFDVTGRSAVDHQGKPYPLLYLRWSPPPPPDENCEGSRLSDGARSL